MQLTALRNNKGVTLVEVMIALVVMLIIFMGLIQASVVAIDSNSRNNLRDEAVRLTSDLMSQLRAAPFDDLDGNATLARGGVPMAEIPASPDPVAFTINPLLTSRTMRNAQVQYMVNAAVATADATHKQITLTTTWTWRGEIFTHAIVAVRGR